MNITSIKTKTYNIILAFLVAVFFAACSSSQQTKPVEESSEPVEYPVGYIAKKIATSLSDTTQLFPFPEGFLEVFLQKHTQYDGTHPAVATEFPREWGVVLVERLPEGRELYQIQSQNREWVYLVITFGYETPQIIDLLPVAVNLVQQTQDILETEIWTTARETDGAFSVQKKYEWVRSVENVSQQEYEKNPQNYLRTKTVKDTYFINNSFHFERVVVEDIPDYAAVIFYYKEEKPEEWDMVVALVQSFCEDYSLLFAEVHDNFNKVTLYDYKLNFITELDITPFMNLQEGVIFIKREVVPKSVSFGSYERLKIEAKRYFKIVEV